ncbi:hypothetical protein [Rhodoplanes sp. Z2-YC6860]|uniref:hypothetical protein n=1 Tax=Rhodoplanes sp. Z2-YC6860 TaxID=674703 RepID=UPI000836F3A1|nr:hypothetical protein [Rhodoplanes sp. Z2-YC6860]
MPMLRLLLVASLALILPLSSSSARDLRKAPKSHERTGEKFLNGTDADRDAVLKDVMKMITERGYREVSVVPWFVMMAKNSRGREVMLLVDPVELQIIEFEHDDDETAAVSETLVPTLHD